MEFRRCAFHMPVAELPPCPLAPTLRWSCVCVCVCVHATSRSYRSNVMPSAPLLRGLSEHAGCRLLEFFEGVALTWTHALNSQRCPRLTPIQVSPLATEFSAAPVSKTLLRLAWGISSRRRGLCKCAQKTACDTAMGGTERRRRALLSIGGAECC